MKTAEEKGTNMNKALVGVASVLLLGATAVNAGVSATWTGAQDGFWTNANNWAEGVIPGQYRDLAGNLAGAICGTATFGSDALTGNRVTTIDFDGVYSISNLFTTGTAAFTYGTSSTQEVPLEALGTFSAAETPDTPPATMVALLRLGIDDVILGYGAGTMTIRNNSRSLFTLNDWGTHRKGNVEGIVSQPGVKFTGSGDIRLAGSFKTMSAGLSYVMAHFAQTGRFVFGASTAFRQLNFDKDDNGQETLRRIEIEKDVEVKTSECGNCYYFNTPTDVSGEGTLYFGYKRGKVMTVLPSRPVNISCNVSAKSFNNPASDDEVDPLRLIVSYGVGPLTITGANDIKGVVTTPCGADTSKPPVFAAPTFGCKGTYGNFGDCTFRMGDKSSLRYLGEGETMDRDIGITNYSAVAQSSTFNLQQCGTGMWNVTSPVTLLGNLPAGVLVLSNGTEHAEATFSGTLAANISVEKRGGGTWTFAPTSTYTDKIVLKGGVLRIGASMHISSLDPASGTSVVRINDGCELELDGVSRTGSATVEIIPGADSVVKVNNVTPGVAIPGVTICGVPATVDAEGNLVILSDGSLAIWKQATSGDWSIAANWAGGYLPSKERETFITANGGSYTVTLDQDWGVTNTLVKNANGGTSRLMVTNGATLTVTGHCTDDTFAIAEGGRVDIVDATLRIEDLAGPDGNPSTASPLKLKGGELYLGGTGALYHVSPPIAKMTVSSGNMDSRLFFGTGTTTFGGDSTFQIVPETNQVVGGKSRSSVFCVYVRGAAAGETAILRFTDRAHPAFGGNNAYELHLGGNNDTALLEFDSAFEGTGNDLWMQKYIGDSSGCGTLRFLRGKYVGKGYDSFLVGVRRDCAAPYERLESRQRPRGPKRCRP